MKTYSFKVVVEPDEDALGNPAWHAYCPALEGVGAATSGRTREEALKNINEVVRMIVEEFLEKDDPFRRQCGRRCKLPKYPRTRRESPCTA